MNLRMVGCSHHIAPVAIRERLALCGERKETMLLELSTRLGCEAAILSTCNRAEIYIGQADPTACLPDGAAIRGLWAAFQRIDRHEIDPHLVEHSGRPAVGHLFGVAASLESLVVGEGQIAGQVKQAYEDADGVGTVGPLLHALFQRALKVAKRARSETSISAGRVSVSSVAVEYVRQVFERFDDKTILVLGAGKMGELTLRHLRHLEPRRILVANRSPEKAQAVASACGGVATAWEMLDDALAGADIVLSTTGAPEPIVSLARWQKIRARRQGRPAVILDIAVPRDFDPDIHDGDLTCLFNIDDLQRVREQTLQSRRQHVAAVEAIVAEERDRLLTEWTKRQNGPTIARLNQELEAKRRAIVQQLFSRLNGKLGQEDRAYIEGAFRLLQNQFLHAPLSALADEPHDGGSHTLLDALRKLFGLKD